MNTRLANPYVVGAPLSGSQGFYGREEVFRFVNETLAVPVQNVIVLYGQRRIGKTSLLHQLVKRMEGNFHAVLFDLQGKGQHDLPALLRDLSEVIARSLKLPAPDLVNLAADRDRFRESFLPQVYAALGGRRLLVLFDEFDVLGDEPSSSDDLSGNHLFEYLRTWLAQDPRLACIFVIGRRLDELPIHYRSLFKQAVFRRLSVLPRFEAIELIARPAAGAIDFSSEAIDAILDLTTGHPYLTQLICHVIYKRVFTTERRTIQAADVEACLDEAMELGTGGLDWFWEGLPRAERIMLSALAETLRSHPAGAHRASGNGSSAKAQPGASEDEVLQTLGRYRVRLLGVELTSARQRLLEWEILARDGDTYRFAVDLVRRWIAREHPLDRAQEDIDLISQRATRYFSNARDAHLAGDLALAIEDYRRALAANPQHFGARLGLAQSLQESNDLPSAIAEYEKAYQLDPSSTRDGLVSARLALGAALQERGDLAGATAEFEQVLRLAPSDDEARARLISLWIRRGEAELKAGRYAPGIEALSRALDTDPDDLALQTRVKSIVRRFSEMAEARGMWEASYESLSRLHDKLSTDEQIRSWLDDTRSRWRSHNYYEMARRASAAGDHQTTIEECRRALEANPNHAPSRLLLASVLYQTGALSDAIEEYEKAYRLDAPSAAPGLAQARLQRGVELEAHADLVAAVADYERALEVQPHADTARRRLPEIWMRWGSDHLAAGKLDDAVGVFRKALLVAEQPQTLVRPIKSRLSEFSQAQRAMGNWDGAVAALSRLRSDLMLRDRETDGWLIDVWLQRGEAVLDSGQYREVARAFKQALQIGADTSDAAALLSRVKSTFFTQADAHLKAAQPELAVSVLTTLIEIVGSDAENFAALARAWLARGAFEFKRDRLDEAEAAYQRALELQPDSPEAVTRLTTVAERRKRLTIERLRAQAAAHVERREWAQAEALYRELVFDLHDEASHPLFANASDEIRLEELYQLAQSFHARGNWEAAIPVWVEICHNRYDYVGRDGQRAALLLAEAIERDVGIAQANEQQQADLRKRLRLAWAVAIVFGAIAIGGLVYVLSSGLLTLS